MWSRHFFTAIFFISAVMAHGLNVSACTDTEVVDKIIGVDKAGRFLLHRFGRGGGQCHGEEFLVYDGEGKVIAEYDSNTSYSDDCVNEWTGAGDLPVDVLPAESTDSLLHRLQQAMGLTPLKKGHRRVVTQQSTAFCMRAWLILPLGWFPVWTVREMPFGDCRDVQMTTKKHRHSELIFLEYSYVSGLSCTHTESSVHWVHPGFIEAMTWLRRAESLLADGAFKAAENAAVESLKRYSGMVQAHVTLAKSLLKQNLSFEEAKQRMGFNFQSYLPCETGWFVDFVGVLYGDEFHVWSQSLGFEEWLISAGEQHDTVHPGENNPQSGWGPNSVELFK